MERESSPTEVGEADVDAVDSAGGSFVSCWLKIVVANRGEKTYQSEVNS